MFHHLWRHPAASVAVSLALCCTTNLLGQAGTQGTVTVTVTDASNAAVRGATLELTQVSTNAVRTSKTEGKGTFNFVGLPIGTYRLSVMQNGFATTQVDTVIVQASQTTPVNVVLRIGNANETVSVEAVAAPLLDSTSNSIGQVIDMKSIENLPLLGRDLTALTRLTAGYAGNGSDGIWNGQPLVSQGVNIDGVVGSPSRGKYDGNAQAVASPRVENIAEMAIQTDQLDLDQGFGSSTTQISYVTRSGSNKFHGRAYLDARNSGLNANSYSNNASGLRRGKQIFNEFGGSVGGPILRDKLFFFGSFSTRRVPGTSAQSNSYLTPSAQGGSYTYVDSKGLTHTVNLLQLAGAAGLPSQLNGSIRDQLTKINNSLSSGNTLTTSDPNLNSVAWNSRTKDVYYWPTFRLDSNTTSKLHTYLAGNMTQRTLNGYGQPPFPGQDFSNQYGSYFTRAFTLGLGADYQVTPRIVNQFKAGYLYATASYDADIPPLYATQPYVSWSIASSGQTYATPSSRFYPVMNLSDSISWQKGSHSLKFGGLWVREQDHYYNNPAGFPQIQLGLASGDPALSVVKPANLPGASSAQVSEAQSLYATLAGRISSVYGSYAYSSKTKQYLNGIGAYNLNELQKQWGFFFQDSWRAFPTLTFNYGIRWDFIGDNHDLTNAYHSITEGNLYAPSTKLFAPGALGGNTNPTIDTIQHSYSPYNVTPQPQFGFAWNPTGDTQLGKLLGHGDTVIRGGYSLKKFTMPQQYYWNNTSSYGAFFFQNFYLNANNTGQAGTFAPGSLSLGNALPKFGVSPASFVTSEALSDFTFSNSLAYGGMDKHIQQPYTQSWNLGVERKFGKRAIEIRYEGNRVQRLWTPLDTNEVNVFENGFLQQFKNAQANYRASGGATFKGAAPTPLFDAAFSDEALDSNGNPVDYSNGNFSTILEQGQVGSMAQQMSSIYGTTSYFCNLVGARFAPCANNAGYTGSGAGYAANFFQANPYAAGQGTSLMKAVGYSNYNSLQTDFRQQNWKGWTFDVNYTFAKNLGVSSAHDYTGYSPSVLTLRNLAAGYGPLNYDIRHTMHFTSTYDLPFGRGRAFLSHNNALSSVVGNWSIGSVMTIASGAPNLLAGGNATYNDYADGGLTLTGVTAKQLQQSVKVQRVPGKTYATLIDRKYLSATDGTGSANSRYITPNTSPGTIGQRVFLYGPKGFYHDLSATKAFPIYDSLQLRFQGEFINVWNHPVFGSVPYTTNSNTFNANVQSPGFATGYVTNSPRVIELRVNIDF